MKPFTLDGTLYTPSSALHPRGLFPTKKSPRFDTLAPSCSLTVRDSRSKYRWIIVITNRLEELLIKKLNEAVYRNSTPRFNLFKDPVHERDIPNDPSNASTKGHAAVIAVVVHANAKGSTSSKSRDN